jgi:hypothetical protein
MSVKKIHLFPSEESYEVNNSSVEADDLALVPLNLSFSNLSDKPKAYVTETWSSGPNWYRKWSDGFLEQGGIATVGSTNYAPLTFPHPFSNTDYSISGYANEVEGTTYGAIVKVSGDPAKASTSCGLTATWVGGGATGYLPKDYTIYWMAVGY